VVDKGFQQNETSFMNCFNNLANKYQYNVPDWKGQNKYAEMFFNMCHITQQETKWIGTVKQEFSLINKGNLIKELSNWWITQVPGLCITRQNNGISTAACNNHILANITSNTRQEIINSEDIMNKLIQWWENPTFNTMYLVRQNVDFILITC
jgi:hypothetical protein